MNWLIRQKGTYNSPAKKHCSPAKRTKPHEGGMTPSERAAYNKKTGGNLKAPQPGGGSRRTSYCARSKGQMKMHNINCSKTPDKRICAARRRWKC